MEVGFLLAETKGVYANLQTATFEKCIRQKCLFLGHVDRKILQNAYNSYPAYYKIIQYYRLLWTFHNNQDFPNNLYILLHLLSLIITYPRVHRLDTREIFYIF